MLPEQNNIKALMTILDSSRTCLANQEAINLIPFKSYGTLCSKGIKIFQVFFFLRLIDTAKGQTKLGLKGIFRSLSKVNFLYLAKLNAADTYYWPTE